MRTKLKNWTILIYANGNNDLEPEIYRTKAAAELTGSTDRINVIMQLGRADRKLVEIIRPKDHSATGPADEWSGVRRYHVRQPDSPLIHDLGKVNLADPKILEDFIVWGVTSFPARHYIIALAGHGIAGLALLPDLSQDIPYMMSIPQMSAVFDRIYQKTGVRFDLLLLDICYMNTLEVIHELGHGKPSPVKHLITYIRDGPVDGLPYDKLIRIIQQSHRSYPWSILSTLFGGTTGLVKSIALTLNANLIAIKMKPAKCHKIKACINKLVDCGPIAIPPDRPTAPLDFMAPSLDKAGLKQYQTITRIAKNLIIHHPVSNAPLLHWIEMITRKMQYTNDQIGYLPLIYFSMRFSRENHWSRLLIGDATSPVGNSPPKLPVYSEAMIMPPRVIRNLLAAMNPTLADKEIDLVFAELCLYKGWDPKTIRRQLALFIREISAN